jgi:hypothetical protein
MELMIGGIILKAVVLGGILFLVARHEADFQLSKLVLVTCGITVGTFAIEVFLAPALANYMPYVASAAVVSLLAFAFVTFMVVRFCWVRLWKGFLVTLLFMGFSIGLSVASAIVVSKINLSVDKAGGSMMEQNNKEALQMFQEMTSVTASQMMSQTAAENATSAPGLSNAVVEQAALTPLATSTQPVSVEPPPPEPPSDELPAFARTPEWQAAQAKIKVSAVLVERDGSNTAIVNGEVLGIGDVLSVEVKKKVYRFKMAEITTDWVAWDPLGETDAE